MATTAMDSTQATEGDAYRDSPAVALAALPRPQRPRHLTGLGPSDVDLDADLLLPTRFELARAKVEETWRHGATASRDGVVLAASVIGVADNLFVGTAYPRTRGILRASIPRTVGSFVAVRRRHAGVMSWAARIGLVREHVPAIAALRDALFVRGDNDAASSLLTSEVAAALLVVEPMLWRLSAGHGRVELAWRTPSFSAEVVLPLEAVDVVVAMARASVGAR